MMLAGAQPLQLDVGSTVGDPLGQYPAQRLHGQSRAWRTVMTSQIITLIALALAAPAWAADTPKATPVSAPDTSRALEQFRNDLQAKRADLMAKGLTLTAEQASKFWPLFETFQKEQSAIMDTQFQAAQKFTDDYANLTDAGALTYVNALLERDAKMHDLRVKWLDKFQTVVPPKIAARAVQIDRRLGLTTQIAISSQVPLIQ